MDQKQDFFKRVLLWNTTAFPFFAVLTVALIVLEAATYSGFIKSRLFLDINTIFILLIISGIFASGTLRISKVNKDKLEYYRLLGLINKLFLPALIVMAYIFLSMEVNNFPGYLYTKGFRFNPFYFFQIIIISFSLLLFDSLLKKEMLSRRNHQPDESMDLMTYTKKNFSTLTVAIIIIWLFLSNMIAFIQEALPRTAEIIGHPFADHTWKMRTHLGGDWYDFMQFINMYTPKDSVFMRMKQQGQYPALSNDGYTRAFIYPRRTKEGTEASLNDQEIKYVFIHRAYGPPRIDHYIGKWPTFKVPAIRIIYMDNNDFAKPPIILNQDYDPAETKYDDLWGLIELKR